MGWLNPRTWVVGEVVTAALGNAHWRDNLRYLKGLDGGVTIDDDLTVPNLITAGNVDGVDVSALDAAVVKKALFDAQTILAATNDDTPAAVTMAASTILARLAAGNIVAATTAQVMALLSGGATADFSMNTRRITNILAPDAAGCAMIKGTRATIAELPVLTTGSYWLGVGGVPAEAVAPNRPFVKLETRDIQAASGNVAYTGYGFQPTGLIITAYLSVNEASIGSSEPALAEQCVLGHAGALKGAAKIVDVGATAGAGQGAVLASYDADGFTLTWTKVGAPGAGTINLHVFAFKNA